jgi:hypothetical protein
MSLRGSVLPQVFKNPVKVRGASFITVRISGQPACLYWNAYKDLREAAKDGSEPATEDVVALAYFRTLLGKQAVMERQQLDILLGSMTTSAPLIVPTFWMELLPEGQRKKLVDAEPILKAITSRLAIVDRALWGEVLGELNRRARLMIPKTLPEAERRRIRDTVEARSIQFYMDGDQAKELTRVADESTKMWVYPPPIVTPQKRGLLSRIFG